MSMSREIERVEKKRFTQKTNWRRRTQGSGQSCLLRRGLSTRWHGHTRHAVPSSTYRLLQASMQIPEMMNSETGFDKTKQSFQAFLKEGYLPVASTWRSHRKVPYVQIHRISCRVWCPGGTIGSSPACLARPDSQKWKLEESAATINQTSSFQFNHTLVSIEARGSLATIPSNYSTRRHPGDARGSLAWIPRWWDWALAGLSPNGNWGTIITSSINYFAISRSIIMVRRIENYH